MVALVYNKERRGELWPMIYAILKFIIINKYNIEMECHGYTGLAASSLSPFSSSSKSSSSSEAKIATNKISDNTHWKNITKQ